MLSFSSPEICIVAIVVMMSGTTDQTLSGLLNKLQAHSSASVAQPHGTKNKGWKERQSETMNNICTKYLDFMTTETV